MRAGLPKGDPVFYVNLCGLINDDLMFAEFAPQKDGTQNIAFCVPSFYKKRKEYY
jgi:hypothetical protein